MIAIVGLPLVIYASALLDLSWLGGSSPAVVRGFDPEYFAGASAGTRIASLAAALGACGFLFAAPALLALLAFRAKLSLRAAAPVWSILLNSVALIAICALLRPTSGLNRVSFAAAWGAWSIGLGVMAWKAGRPREALRELWSPYWGGVGIATVTVGVGVGLFWQDQFLQCFNGDGTESFELARSLRHHVLPTWEIEPIDRFGAVIVNPALVNSYWTFALQLLLGEGEFATRLPYWAYWFGILLVSYRIQRQFGRSGIAPMLLLGLGALLATLWYTFFVGYDSYMADLANPGVPDALFTLCLLLGFDCLLQRSMSGWIAATVLGSLVLYAGPVMFVLTAVAAFIWRPVERARVVRGAIAGATILTLIAGLYLLWGWADGLLEGWWITLQGEYVNDYFAPIPRWRSGLLYVGYFVLGCGGLPAVGLIGAFRRSAWERTVAAVVLGYLLIVLGSAAKNLHYLGPLLSPTLLLWTLRPAGRRRGEVPAAAVLAAASLCIAIALCWPRSRPIFTLNREVGENTTYQTSSYEEACRWADLAIIYDLGITSWDIGPHTWVGYSVLEASPSEQRAILVTTAERLPDGYAVRGESASGVKICLNLRDPEAIEWLRWAATRRPETGPERFPWVLRDIAPRPRPRLPLQPRGAARHAREQWFYYA